MLRGQVTVEGIEQVLLAGLEPGVGIAQQRLSRLPRHQGLDHRPTRFAVEVTDDDTEANPTVGEHLVDPVLLAGEDAGQFLHLARDQT